MAAVTSGLPGVSDLCVDGVSDEVITEDSSFPGDYGNQHNVVCIHTDVNSEKVVMFLCTVFAKIGYQNEY
jgi:hypothetical protein